MLTITLFLIYCNSTVAPAAVNLALASSAVDLRYTPYRPLMGRYPHIEEKSWSSIFTQAPK